MSVNYREPQWLLPNEKNLQYPAAGATQGSGLTADRHSLYSMYFNVDHRIDLGSSINLDVNSTISFWYKTSTNNNGSVVFGESTYAYEYLLQWGSSLNKIYFRIGSVVTDFTGVTEIEDGNWHHYCITRTGANAELFVDGASRSTVTGLPTGTNTLIDTIGSTPSGTHTIDNSYLDEIAFWSRSLSSSEISTLYNNGSPSNPMLLSGKPIAYYPLGEQARNPNGSSDWRFPNEVLQSQVFEFDTTNHINTGYYYDATTTPNLSLSFWTKSNVASNFIFPVSIKTGGNSYTNSIVMQYNRKLLISDGSWVFGTASISDNTWHHVFVTAYYDGATTSLNMYVDGNTTPDISVSNLGTGTNAYLQGNLYVGNYNGASNGWPGEISNVVAWESNQFSNLSKIYNNGSPQTSYTVTPTAWYKLDKTSEYAGLNPNWHSALSFNGSSNYVNLGSIDETEGITTMSISGWFKPASSGVAGASGIVAKESRDWYVGWYSSPANSIRFLISDDDGVTNDSLNSLTLGSDAEVLDKWQHFVCTWDASDKLKIYINGILSSEASSTNAVSSLPASTNSVELGRRVTTYFDGQISNLAIYNQVISPEDVKYLYNGGTPQTNISFEPLSWYKLNNTGTGIQDSGSASNNGTNSGATAVSSSVAVDQWNFDNAVQSQTPNWSSALKFDDTNDYIDCGNNSSLQISTDISISCWFRCTDQGILFSKGQYAGETGVAGYNYQISVRSPGYGLAWQWYTTSSEGASTGNRIYYLATTGKALTVIDGQWHNIVVTRSSSNSKLYVDGEYIASTGNTGTDLDYMVNSSQNVTIGDASNSPSDPFPGDISNIQIWNTQLTDADALSIYNSGQPSTTAFGSPVSWWKLDNTTTGIQDSIGSNNGTNNGATETQTNVWTPRLNGESDTLPSTALVSSDLQFNSAYSSFSLDFDGTNDYVDCTDSDTFTFGNGTTDTPFSLSGWVNADSMNKFKMIAKMDATDFEYQFGTNATGKLSFTLYSLNTSNRIQRSYNSTAVSGVWQHWVATYDGSASVSGLKIYINGVRVDDTTATVGSYTAMQNTTSTLKLATTTLSNYANGKMDELAVFNKELNQAEITSIYNNGYPKDITALAPISWWRLGEDAYFDGTDFTIPNKISGAPNGTSDNMAATALVAAAPGSSAAGLGSSLALDDRVGDAALSTANSLSFNMTPVNRVSYPAGYVPTQADNVYSMAFDGANDYISTSDIRLGNTYSISLWFNAASFPSTNPVLISQYTSGLAGRFFLGVRDDGGGRKITAFSAAHNYGSTVISTSTWYNVVLVNNNNTVTLYLNGAVDGNFTFSSAPPDTDILIGALDTTPSNPWDGNIDEVAIFDYALSARQIKQDIYNGTTSGKTADLNNISNLTAPVAWYRMGD